MYMLHSVCEICRWLNRGRPHPSPCADAKELIRVRDTIIKADSRAASVCIVFATALFQSPRAIVSIGRKSRCSILCRIVITLCPVYKSLNRLLAMAPYNIIVSHMHKPHTCSNRQELPST